MFKHYILQALFFVLCTLCVLIQPTQTYACAYGEGNYSEGVYNGDCNTENTPSTLETITSSIRNAFSNPSVCNDRPAGVKAPELYAAIPKSGNEIELYFTDGDDPFDYYYLQYGTKPSTYEYGQEKIAKKNDRTYVVSYLKPNTKYYFELRTGNGCATGAWSNEISATTRSLISKNMLDITSSTLTVAERPERSEATASAEMKAHSIYIQIKDPAGNPLPGAHITLHSNVQEAKTDENGQVYFDNVEPGDHTLIIEHENYTGEQSLHLTGDVKTFNLEVTVRPQNVFFSKQVIFVVSILVGIIVVLLFTVFRLRMKENHRNRI